MNRRSQDPTIRWWEVLLGSLLFAGGAFGVIWVFAILAWAVERAR